MLASEAGLHVGAGQGRSLRVLSSQLEIKAGEEAGLRFGMFRSCFPPGTGMPFLHLHRSYEEAFHVLAGEVQFQLGANEIRASTGSTILVPAGVPHCFRNSGAKQVEWIVIAAPAAAVTATEEIAQVGPGELDRLAEILERHDSELLERRPHWAAAP